jgi:hypothetical protein
MNSGIFKWLLVLCLFLVLTAACAPGNERFAGESPAGFWAGLWHGAIGIITFIISLFTDAVSFYESNNSGSWYDFGFVLGILCVWGSGTGSAVKCKKWGKSSPSEQDWDEIGRKVEKKIMGKIKVWAEAEDDSDWEEVSKKAEKKLKKKIKEWLDEE